MGKILLALATVVVTASATPAKAETEILAPGWGPLRYDPPVPGSYALPPLGYAGVGEVLTDEGAPQPLDGLYGDKIVLLSFVYSACSDINGCPLANAVFYKISERLSREPELADTLRLLSLSFDPRRDTPEVMRLYGNSFQGGGVEWRFLTTRSEVELQPILDSYDQFVIKEYDENGEYTGAIAHVLRVFLIDRDKRIRNIYSASFLHEDVLISDIKTLLLEEG